MALMALWKQTPDQIRPYALRQIIAMAGDGRVIDGSACSNELRAFLREVDVPELERFTGECLEEGFEASGFALQDVINEVGRRLEFDTEPGLYRGRRGQTGFDGVWRSEEDLEFVVEVKTTDTYNVNLDRVAAYRHELIAAGRLKEDSSVLFVVGRQDTGALEAQIRGSPHAWTMRVIGAVSLVQLLKVKNRSDSGSVARRIRALLRPVEYTRLDGIADLMFETTTEVDISVEAELGATEPPAETVEVRAGGAQRAASSSPASGIEAFRRVVADGLSRELNVRLVKKRRSLFAAPGVNAVIAVSKRYDRGYQPYWYALYEAQLAFLQEAPRGILVLGTLDTRAAYALPVSVVAPLTDRLKFTRREQGQLYWHIAVRLDPAGPVLPLIEGELDISPYRLNIG
jgi:hypothetical protein